MAAAWDSSKGFRVGVRNCWLVPQIAPSAFSTASNLNLGFRFNLFVPNLLLKFQNKIEMMLATKSSDFFEGERIGHHR